MVAPAQTLSSNLCLLFQIVRACDQQRDIFLTCIGRQPCKAVSCWIGKQKLEKWSAAMVLNWALSSGKMMHRLFSFEHKLFWCQHRKICCLCKGANSWSSSGSKSASAGVAARNGRRFASARSPAFRRLSTLCWATVVPVVPHKAVAEVSKIGNYRRGELL